MALPVVANVYQSERYFESSYPRILAAASVGHDRERPRLPEPVGKLFPQLVKGLRVLFGAAPEMHGGPRGGAELDHYTHDVMGLQLHLPRRTHIGAAESAQQLVGLLGVVSAKRDWSRWSRRSE